MMTKRIALLATPSLVLALALSGCTLGQMPIGRVAAVEEGGRAEGAQRFYSLAQKAVRAGDIGDAIVQTERAVEASPRDLAYRMLLGDLYLKNGRFLSAEMAFRDVLHLAPGNGRALFSLSLAQIANGRNSEALAQLDRLATDRSPADIGLAYALAGDPMRAVALLEAAARQPGADGRIRQNLALAYAITGDWRKAHVTAAQDLSPAQLSERMAQWAAFVQPAGPADQVAGMLGVTPREDAGQPVELALAPASGDVAFAALQAPPAPEITIPPEAANAAEPVAEAALVEVEAVPTPPLVQKRVLAASKPQAARPKPGGRFVVQLAAYGSAEGVKQGWTQLRKRYGLGGDYRPFGAAVTVPNKGKVHRLSVGFATQGEAANACRTIKAKGGSCFVRENSGDRPLQV